MPSQPLRCSIVVLLSGAILASAAGCNDQSDTPIADALAQGILNGISNLVEAAFLILVI